MFTHIIIDRDGNTWTITCDTQFLTVEAALDAMFAAVIDEDMCKLLEARRGKAR